MVIADQEWATQGHRGNLHCLPRSQGGGQQVGLDSQSAPQENSIVCKRSCMSTRKSVFTTFFIITTAASTCCGRHMRLLRNCSPSR